MTQQDGICPIWGNECGATVNQYKTLIKSVDKSTRADGSYEIAIDAEGMLSQLGATEKAKLTTWLIDQRDQGDEYPLVTSDIVVLTAARPNLPVYERAHRLLRFIADQVSKVGENTPVGTETHAAYAWSESTQWQEVVYCLDYLKEQGWIRGVSTQSGMFQGTVTVAGYGRIQELRTNVDSSQAFVAMWFDESLAKAYEEGIRPAIEQSGYKPLRIDQKEHINKIDDEIIGEIRRSRFLVADFTQGTNGARGGVYYEAGFGHGLDLQVIFTCREDYVQKLHFDTNHYNHIVWTNPQDLCEKLRNRILAVIGEGPARHISQ